MKRLIQLLFFISLAALNGAALPVLKLSFPERAQLQLTEPIPAEAQALRLSFKAPEDLPETTMLTIYAKDQDSLWRQIRLPYPKSNSITVPLAGQAAETSWQCYGHQRPWNCLTQIQQYGIILEQDTGKSSFYQGELTIAEITPILEKTASYDGSLKSFTCTKDISAGDTWECSFKINCWPKAPFDSQKTNITAKIQTPAGTEEQVKGFYYEPFIYDEEEWDKTQCLTPSGAPSFKVRYCPLQPGKYTIRITAEIDSSFTALPPVELDVKPNPAFHGIINLDKKNNMYFSYSDGTPFTGIGINVRSPYDNRYRDVAQHSTWQDQGLSMYARLFRKYRDCGVNVVEVWMCSWWLALEWIYDSPGFHGVGYYNQYRAWMLDYIMQLARENNIKIILVINNHGKFAMHYDTEWARNPYNKKNGGYLDKCEEYYTNEKARQDTKKLLDYIVARWGAYPQLLAWKLFTEVDLTGPDIEFYKRTTVIADWHAEMGAYLKKIDRYQHPATTHWMLSYQRIDERTANVKELDFLTTDVYYWLGQGTKGMMDYLHNSRDFALRHKKPLIITEFGGSSYADHLTNLVKQVPSGIWFGYFNEMGIVPMNWWFALIEDKNLYYCYKALSNFTKGEDRRNMVLSTADIQGHPLKLRVLSNDTKILAWIFDTDYFFSQTENVRPKEMKSVQVQLPTKTDGTYQVEFWNTHTGTIVATNTVAAKDKIAELVLPDFKEHLALKLIKK